MKFAAATFGQDESRYPGWVKDVQAQLKALHAGPRSRWRRFRRCDIICRQCESQLGQVMETSPPVLVMRHHVFSYEHPHAVSRKADIRPADEDDPEDVLRAYDEEIDTHVLAMSRARLDRSRYWWIAIDRISADGDLAGPEPLMCECRTVTLTREQLLDLIDGKQKAIL